MKVCCISDLHGNLPDIKDMPKAELLVISGDVCPQYGAKDIMAAGFQCNWINNSFASWIFDLRYRYGKIVITGGNHDFVFWFNSFYKDISKDIGCDFLIDSMCEYDGLKIWGTPWQLPYGHGWCFNAEEDRIKFYCDMIPKDIDILVSHGPPFGYGDLVGGRNTGSRSLMEFIDSSLVRLVCVGHIHSAYGVYEYKNKKIVNSALADEYNFLKKTPIVVEV